MAKVKKQLVLKIEQSGNVFYRRLAKRDFISIGRSQDNDITLYGESFPKKHVLFARKNNHIQLRLKKFMTGEVKAGDSRLAFKDMILHNLLPRKRDDYFYPLTQDKIGYLQVGDAKITFKFDAVPAKSKKEVVPIHFKGYSWLYAMVKDLGRDIPFKLILLFFILFHAFMLRYMKEHAQGFSPYTKATKVPERLTKFVIKKQPVAELNTSKPAAAGNAKEETSSEPKAKKSEASKRKANIESQGVLGLLSGTGVSDQSNALADVLLDKGLATSLDEVMSNSKLTVGKGTGVNDDLDKLLNLADLDNGIDDIIGDVDEVESVSFAKKGEIQLERVGEIKGTPGAVGQRSEESVRSVLAAYMGRMKYIYEKYLKHDETFGGKMVVEVVIAASGKVENAKIITSNMNNPEFEREILDVIRRWKYAPIDQGTVTVTYPMVFNKIG